MKRFAELACALLGLPPAAGRAARLATLAVFAPAAALACGWSISGWHAGLGVAVLALSATAALCMTPRLPLAVRAPAAALLLLVHAAWLALAEGLLAVVAWSVPGWQWAALAASVAAILATAIRRTRLRVPTVLPIGLAIGALLAGWDRENGLLHCDDYTRLRAAGATLVIPTTPALAQCRPGETLAAARFPRQFWEDPNGERYLVTTQNTTYASRSAALDAAAVDRWFTGAVCSVRLGDPAPPECMGAGKAEGIAESADGERFFVAPHDDAETTVYILPRHGALRPLAAARVPARAALFYVDEARDVLALSEDDREYVYRLRARDLAPFDRQPAPFVSDQMRYDAAHNEGIACGSGSPLGGGIDGEGFSAVAYTGQPFTIRPLAPTSRNPTSWVPGTWGCDWDPKTRRAWVAVAPLGVVQEIDYDSGDVLRRFFVGQGARPVLYDAARRLLYVGFFLSGDVVAVDLDSGDTVRRWPAGRFVRYLALSRDGGALLVASSLGIVRIPLDDIRAGG